MSNSHTSKRITGFLTIKLTSLSLALVLLGACSVYKPSITQGNILTAEQVNELKLGMTRQQVQQTLGASLLQDIFNANRWDYIYRNSGSSDSLQQRVFTVFFDENGKLNQWTGQVAPIQNEIKISEVAPQIMVQQLASSEPNTALVSPSPAQTIDLIPPPKTEVLISDAAIQGLLEEKVAKWRSAWIAKDMAAYTDHYTGNYTGSFSSRAGWLASRQRIIGDAANMLLTINNIKGFQTSPTEARVTFTQTYKSASYGDSGSKILYLQREGNRWLIVSELFTKQT